jgi:hypothetical protein
MRTLVAAELFTSYANIPEVSRMKPAEATEMVQRYMMCTSENCDQEFDVLTNKKRDCKTHPGMQSFVWAYCEVWDITYISWQVNWRSTMMMTFGLMMMKLSGALGVIAWVTFRKVFCGRVVNRTVLPLNVELRHTLRTA